MHVTSRFFGKSMKFRIWGLAVLGMTAVIAASCGGSSSGPPALKGNTTVILTLSSTANDQLSQFDINLTSLSLTTQAGKTVNLFTTGQNPEFIHLNGREEPLLTVSVPQDIYTTANITVGNSGFSCLTLTPSGGLVLSLFGYSNVDTPATVNLPAPITITGAAMALSLNLQVPQSASFPSECFVQGIVPFSITPTFNLAALPLSPPVAERGMKGKVVSVSPSSNGLMLALAGGIMTNIGFPSADGQKISFLTNTETVYQGITGYSSLTAGQLIDVDAVIQADGSQLATRVAVADADLTNLSVMTGPLLQTSSSAPTVISFGQQDQGYLWSAGRAGNYMPYSFDAADFRIAEVANLQDLPFVPRFDATTMFAGQFVYVSSHATILQNWPIYFPATVITLIPQTINGTIVGIAGDGGSKKDYRVMLSAYELMPTLAVQAGQTTVLTDPTEMEVYVDSQTRLRNTQPLNLGSVARFNGLLFNDNGILRMACLQLDNGTAVDPAPARVDSRQALANEQGTVTTRVSVDPVSGSVKVLHQRLGKTSPASVSDVP